jgi:hypothetical protein
MRFTRLKHTSITLAIIALMAMMAFFWTGCGNDDASVVGPDVSGDLSPNADKAMNGVHAAMQIQNSYTPALMSTGDVVGTAIGATDDGRTAILLYTKKAMGASVPAELDGLPTREIISGVLRPISGMQNGRIRPLKGGPPSSSTDDHTDAQTLPIQLGTTGGWEDDLANGYCCGGTFGSLITDGTNKYILSNTHVLAMDIVLGGNDKIAEIGDPCIHPALIDVGCYATNSTRVATLASLASLPQSNVDAAIALIIPGAVMTDGSILEIGTLSSSTVAASLNQLVQKSGRTTGLTKSYVNGLNGTVSITYEDECAGNTAFTQTFYGQIMIYNKRSAFLDSGDSGSLMVEDVAVNPRAVGLLFAGGNFTAIANPIDEVLDYFGANWSMVGN